MSMKMHVLIYVQIVIAIIRVSWMLARLSEELSSTPTMNVN